MICHMMFDAWGDFYCHHTAPNTNSSEYKISFEKEILSITLIQGETLIAQSVSVYLRVMTARTASLPNIVVQLDLIVPI